jgi:hypothetical protein
MLRGLKIRRAAVAAPGVVVAAAAARRACRAAIRWHPPKLQGLHVTTRAIAASATGALRHMGTGGFPAECGVGVDIMCVCREPVHGQLGWCTRQVRTWLAPRGSECVRLFVRECECLIRAYMSLYVDPFYCVRAAQAQRQALLCGRGALVQCHGLRAGAQHAPHTHTRVAVLIQMLLQPFPRGHPPGHPIKTPGKKRKPEEVHALLRRVVLDGLMPVVSLVCRE